MATVSFCNYMERKEEISDGDTLLIINEEDNGSFARWRHYTLYYYV